MLKPADYLSLFRLFSGPVFAYFLSFYGFLFLAFTDWLDGLAARKFGATRFGAWLDPFADKVFIWSYLIVLFFSVPRNNVFTFVLLILFLMDIISTLERTIGYKAGKNVKATWSGKFKMIFQCLAVFLFLLTYISYGEGADADTFWGVWTSNLGFVFLGMALWSMMFSLGEKWKHWRE